MQRSQALAGHFRAMIWVSVSLCGPFNHALPAEDRPGVTPLPNVVLIYADDLGYGDLGCYGAKGYSTPNLDRMAADGVRFTRFYVSQPVCSASRAALLTGCYPDRVGIRGALGPKSAVGLHPDETTIAEVLKTKGYATGMAGKWHLGDAPQFSPMRQGFEEYYGLPYSNDMWPLHPDYVNLPPDSEKRKRGYPPLPLLENESVVKLGLTGEDQARLTTDYTERAVRFIQQHRDRPFFFYLAHSMPHVPLYVSPSFAGKTARGLYGDVIAEIDWSVGRILETLKACGLEQNTLVIFTSDNGPWLSYGDHSGSAGPLREGKGTVWEGGVRVPAIARWPARIPAGRICAEPVMTIDLLPTLARLTGAGLPSRKIDGLDISPLLFGEPGARAPHEALYFYYHDNELQAVMSGPWKLMLPQSYRTLGGKPGGTGGNPAPYEMRKLEQPELYNVEADIAETRDLSAAQPQMVRRLLDLAEQARADLGDRLTGRKGGELREPGRIDQPR